ncbi:transcriptional repressor [Oceanotoga sp. DSM 15011]|jgi:Fur family peroxide stress response transcriptional regulator|uniref:Fur family peroxide stress response transcriptional regulator n=1 Tax=Oceanotoga teriensis TaxID=515440 RepID=A0AA45HHF0_9BACT|nr:MULTISPECIES: Fur family transcriptional regulator [Oceanotoga]MDN5343579.1 Fur family transcriptional regulator, peroxide stress response regulator [Oceanotoga sp.]MDO7977308.1 transcriptional repressor [Oceanotoga teriensis]PWJ86727.1 Fur family peroxide stress response transcriptional regulator [Oceanotoga teriensis]UYP00472.1 transcriptional repressor [Oceanotoga sp. DSM 15011]
MIELYDKDKIVNILKGYSIRVTPNRLKVAEIILNSEVHPSIDEIHTILTKSGKNISFTSVYNIIKMFQSAGIVKEIKSKDRSRYDANLKPHSHFICKNCGRVFDVDMEITNSNFPTSINGMSVDSLEVTYYGLCSECNNDNKDN